MTFDNSGQVVRDAPSPDVSLPSERDITQSSTALRNVSTGADLVGFATLQGVDPVSPANLLDAHTSTRSSFARYEVCETSGLVAQIWFRPTPCASFLQLVPLRRVKSKPPKWGTFKSPFSSVCRAAASLQKRDGPLVE